KRYILMDPYNFTNLVSTSKCLEINQIQEPYIIQLDKIIYTINGEVLTIKDLVEEQKQNYNSI
ncbi:3893_t:CDS:1, partial [Scutellospora calospora]